MTNESEVDAIREWLKADDCETYAYTVIHADHARAMECCRTLLRRIDTLTAERDAATANLARIASKMREAIETEEPDAGIFLLSTDSTFHKEVHRGKSITVYDHQHFTPLGDALMEIYRIARGDQPEMPKGEE